MADIVLIQYVCLDVLTDNNLKTNKIWHKQQ